MDAVNAVNVAMRSRLLHERARAFVSAFEAHAEMPESFDALACDLLRHQHAAIPGYERLCARRGVDIAKLTNVDDAPAVPTDAFKLTRVFALPETDAAVTFRTSGTTGSSGANATAHAAQRGRHLMRDVETYDRAAVAFGRRCLLADFATPRVPVLAMSPSPQKLPDSSLVHMMESFRRELGTFASDRETYFIEGEVIDLAAFDERVASLIVAGSGPVLLLGTSFSFVHFLDALGDDTFRLPAKSRVMQTGGFKGKSREVDAEKLSADISRVFCIDERDVFSEYGMTELSSQFYSRRSRASGTGPNGSRVYLEPPWARVAAVDPETLAPVPDGEIGIARITDLMNVDSAAVVLTQDRVRRVRGDAPGGETGFELLGRWPGAPPRGCSIAIDEILSVN